MFIRFCLVAAALIAAVLPASAQTFPNRTIHIVVAYAPGGTGDIVARLIAVPLAEALGQNIVIENRAGATGAIGTQAVVSAQPDGHTLLMGQTGEIAINQHWVKGLTYNAEKDLIPVALASVVPLALVVPANAPYSTMAELAKALTEKKPLTFASAGTGTPGHFAGEFLKLRTKANLTHVPYKGAGPALNDLLGGHVDMYFPGFPAATPLLKGGQVKILAVSSAKRASGARCADGRRGDQRSALRSDAVAGLLRAGRHACADRQPAQRRDQHDPGLAQHAGTSFATPAPMSASARPDSSPPSPRQRARSIFRSSRIQA